MARNDKGLTGLQLKYIEEKLREQHAALLATQMALNKQWNVLNAVLRALMNDGVLTKANLETAGAQLLSEYEQAKKNGDNNLTPFDTVVSMANKGIKKEV